MSEYVVKSGDTTPPPCPFEFIEDVLKGNGAVIRIEPGVYPTRAIWCVKALLTAMGAGYQFMAVQELKLKGWHHEHAEARISGLVEKLLKVTLPPMPVVKPQREPESEDPPQ